jgi:hypothetical protein
MMRDRDTSASKSVWKRVFGGLKECWCRRRDRGIGNTGSFRGHAGGYG